MPSLAWHCLHFLANLKSKQATDDPLLLILTIENSAAIHLQRENKRMQKIIDQYSQTEAYKNLSEEELEAFNKEYSITEVPELQLGSDRVSLESLIDFQIRNSNGDNIDLEFQGLASNNNQAGAIKLGTGEPLYYQFVAKRDQLQQLASDDYYIIAALDTSEHDVMWNGVAYSNTVSVELNEHHSDPAWGGSNQKFLLISSYYLGNQQYSLAEQFFT